MARQKPPEPPGDDVPGWVMTFSDVITLLMTFFILLLTFATNQPETFDRVQIAMFGGGGSRGIAGKKEGMEQDALLLRQRSRAGRMTQSGSELPPIYADPTLETLDGGIAGLEDEEQRLLSTTHFIRLPLATLLDGDGNLTPTGKQRLRMVAVQMRKMPLQLDLVVGDESKLEEGYIVVEHMTQDQQLPQARVGLGVGSHLTNEQELLLMLDLREDIRGS